MNPQIVVRRLAAAEGYLELGLPNYALAELNSVADPGPFQEFKGETGIPFTCDTSPLTCRNGTVRCPTGPGFGIKIDPDFVRKYQPFKAV